MSRTPCLSEDGTAVMSFSDTPSSVSMCSSTSNSNISSFSDKGLGILELQLIVQWTMSTHRLLGPTFLELQSKEPFMILNHDCLLQAGLAISALHLAATKDHSPTSQQQYEHAAFQYYADAVISLRKDLQRIANGEQSPAALHCAMILVVLSVYPPERLKNQVSYVGCTLAVYEQLQGCLSIALHRNSSPDHTDLTPAVLRQFEPWCLDLMPAVLHQYKPRCLDQGVVSALRLLKQLNQTGREPSRMSPGLLTTLCKQRIIELLEAWWARVDPKDSGSCFLFLLSVPREFMKAVSQGDPVMRLVLMCWGIMMEELCVTGPWWCQGFGKGLVWELIQAIVKDGSQSPESRLLTSWATQRIISGMDVRGQRR